MGDGTVDNGLNVIQSNGAYTKNFYHTYDKSKQYLIKVTGNTKANVILNGWYNNSSLTDSLWYIQIAKIGSDIHLWAKLDDSYPIGDQHNRVMILILL